MGSSFLGGGVGAGVKLLETSIMRVF